MNEQILKFYTSHSKFSNPDKYLLFIKGLPSEVPTLCRWIHGFLIHYANTEKLYSFKPTQKEVGEAELLYIERILDRGVLKNDNLFKKDRKPRERVFASCRDYALLLCSILRCKGISARVRCGFSGYFKKGLYYDHWICEYWNEAEKRWIRVDPEIGSEERKVYNIPEKLDNFDLNLTDFLISSKAWNLCRSKKANPDLFGVHNIGIKGLWFIRASLFRDLACLNKLELLPWHYTKFSFKLFKDIDEIGNEEVALLDNAALLLNQPDKNLKKIITLYNQDPRFNMAFKLYGYLTGDPVKVNFR